MHQHQISIDIKRMLSKNRIFYLIVGLLAALAVTYAYSLLESEQDVIATKEAIRAEAASLQPGAVPEKALSPLREVWEILDNEFVLRNELDPDILAAGAVDGLL
ncbi:uncharacterized protein METZ01_LOCUS194484, partial [marine metagenome]